MASAIYTNEKDQNWADGTTVYWFELNGHDDATGVEFEDDVFGVVESDEPAVIVDYDGFPVNTCDHEGMAAQRLCVVTDAMREE